MNALSSKTLDKGQVPTSISLVTVTGERLRVSPINTILFYGKLAAVARKPQDVSTQWQVQVEGLVVSLRLHKKVVLRIQESIRQVIHM